MKKFLLISLALISMMMSVASAKTTCSPVPGGQRCVSEIPTNKFSTVAATQENSQWCWAACISMIWAYHGHNVAQANIVAANYGAPVNLPSGDGRRISMNLSGRWIDAAGRPFTSTVNSAFDFLAGYNSMNNQMFVNELDAERPVLVASGTHAMVATAVEYFTTPAGPNIINIGVWDPWPGRGYRGLVGCDIVPAFSNCNPPPYSPWNPPIRGGFIYAASVGVSN